MSLSVVLPDRSSASASRAVVFMRPSPTPSRPLGLPSAPSSGAAVFAAAGGWSSLSPISVGLGGSADGPPPSACPPSQPECASSADAGLRGWVSVRPTMPKAAPRREEWEDSPAAPALAVALAVALA